MDVARASVWAAVVVVLGVTLASGPLVGAVDLTHDGEPRAPPGSGSAQVTLRSVPDSAALERGAYGSGSYYLRVPDAVVDLSAVSGQPLLTYKLYVRELGYSHGTTHFLSADTEGRLNVSLSSDALGPDRVTADAYRGELLLTLRSGRGERTLARRNVTVVVRE